MNVQPCEVEFLRKASQIPDDLWNTCFQLPGEGRWWYEAIEQSGIDDQFTLLFRPGVEEKAVVLSPAAELIEPLPAGILDIGEAVAQQLSLVLDPFPRAPGATAASPGEALASPFAALANWKQNN